MSKNKNQLIRDLGFARIDIDRQRRTGFAEVILGDGKKKKQILKIIESLLSYNQNALVTRLKKKKQIWLENKLSQLQIEGWHFRSNLMARTISVIQEQPNQEKPEGIVAIVAAGTSDMPIVEEVRETLIFYAIDYSLNVDVGIAGLHRIERCAKEISQASLAIVIAGMEGALAAIVAGLVRSPVIAVPTSQGYGTGAKGLSALQGMLNACSSSIAVVNIDNGFGAARFATGILKKFSS